MTRESAKQLWLCSYMSLREYSETTHSPLASLDAMVASAVFRERHRDYQYVVDTLPAEDRALALTLMSIHDSITVRPNR